MTQQQDKDPIFGTRSVTVKESGSKALTDATRLSMYFDKEVVEELITTLEGLKSNERGVKLDIHYGKKSTNDGSRQFDSGFMFAKAVGEAVSGGEKSTGPKKFVPKKASNV
jgi:hypothetical protein